MGKVNEIKEEMEAVKSIGNFTSALEQIATMRMVSLRDQVEKSKRFVDEATKILRELNYCREFLNAREYGKAARYAIGAKGKEMPDFREKQAVIVVTSNQGLCGSYNMEVYKKFEAEVAEKLDDPDIYIVGKKGQDYFSNNKKYAKLKFYPYDLPDNFKTDDLIRLVDMFPHYKEIVLVYSRYVNTVERNVVDTLLFSQNVGKTPPKEIWEELEKERVPIKYLFDPTLEELIKEVSNKLRAATFQQQLLDTRLAQFSAQMVGMQAANENVTNMLGDLQFDYNKARRKAIDKKISEVFAGMSLW